MREPNFREWLQKRYSYGTVNSRFSNCQRIETFEGDLDDHFDTGSADELLTKLTYSKADQKRGFSAEHSIPINGNIYTGTATLKQAVRLYFEFRQSTD